jgi:hypothetical protein
MTDTSGDLDNSVDTIRWSEAREEGVPVATLSRVLKHCPIRKDDHGEIYFVRSELTRALDRLAWEDSNK